MSNELLGALIPALAAGVPVLILAFQLIQQNRLERKRVEVEYLRRALEALDLPFRAMMRIRTEAAVLAIRHRAGPTIDHERQLVQMAAEWELASNDHMGGLSVAMSFARADDDNHLYEALLAAANTGNDLRYLVVEALQAASRDDAKLPARDIQSDERFKQAADERGRAANMLVKRIHRLYG